MFRYCSIGGWKQTKNTIKKSSNGEQDRLERFCFNFTLACGYSCLEFSMKSHLKIHAAYTKARGPFIFVYASLMLTNAKESLEKLILSM